MDTTPEFLEQLWSDLLSRQPELIRAAFGSLDRTSQRNVFIHLEHMAVDSGWQPEQRESAATALGVLGNLPDQEK